jgi:16S rRNA processing protein RimM
VGEFIAALDSDDPSRAERLQKILLRTASKEALFTVAEVWFHDARPILRFAGIDSISAAEPWEHAEILVAPEDRVELDPGAYFDADLIGCSVEQAGSVLGVVVGVEHFGAHPTLVVTSTAGREFLVPFVRALCPEIDVTAKRIRVELPDGLVDL